MGHFQKDNKKIAKNTLMLYIRMIIIILLQFYISRELLTLLGETDFGIYNVVGGLVSMMTFFNTSISNGYQRFFNLSLGSNDYNSIQKIFSTSLLIQTLVVIVVLVIAESIGLWFLNNKMTIPESSITTANIVFQCSLAVFILNIYRAPINALIIAEEKMTFYAYISIIEVIANLAIIFLTKFLPGNHLMVYSLLTPFVALIIFLSYIFYLNKSNTKVRFKIIFEKKRFKDILSFSSWNLLGSFAHILKSQGINVILNIFFNPIVNAARGIAYQVQAGLSVLYSNFQLASQPQMMKSYGNNDIDNSLLLLYKVSKYSFYLIWVCALPIMLNIDIVLKIWLGDDVPNYTSLFCILTISTATIESLATPITTLVHASGKIKNFQIICSSVILSILPLSYFVLKQGYPPQAAMWVSLIIVSIVHFIRIILLKRIITEFSILKYLTKVISIIFIISAISVIVGLQIIVVCGETIISGIFILITTSMIIFTIGLNNSEKEYILNFVKSHVIRK